LQPCSPRRILVLLHQEKRTLRLIYNLNTANFLKLKRTKEKKIKTTLKHTLCARYYNSRLSLWQTADPLVDKYPGWSPYNYTMGNPIIFYDPDGNEIRIAGNKTVAMNDIKDLAGKANMNNIIVNSDGFISLVKIINMKQEAEPNY
jgi:RHS repeat-associated protein